MAKHIITEEYISEHLAEAQKSPSNETNFSAFFSDPPRPAAVLIPLFHKNPDDEKRFIWHILLTRRTDAVAEHQGQVAFPGGQADLNDTTPEMTALREAQEEIGLDSSQVKILGRMNSVWTITNFLVTPIVGVIPWPFPIRLEETEVSRVFSIPLDWLVDPAHHEVRQRLIPNPFSQVLHRESHPVIYFQTYQDELLWGVSAQIILNFIDILNNKQKAGS